MSNFSKPRKAASAGRGWRVGLAKHVAGLCLIAAAAAAAAQTAAFTVCMADDNAPLSYQTKGQPHGLDLRIAQATAAELGRPLKVMIFESDFEFDSRLTHEVNAMLTLGVCDAASGFPLISEDLGPPSRVNAQPPEYPGSAKRKRERPFVKLGTLTASRAYSAVALGVALRDPGQPFNSLADLGERKLAVVSGTLAGSVAQMWRSGSLRSRIVSLNQKEDYLEELGGAAPRFEAAILPLALFDGWKLRHPDSKVAAAQWRRPIGVNMGFATLAAATESRNALNTVIARALADGQMARWAAEEGMSWLPPIAPDVGPGPGIGDLGRLAGD